MRKIILTSVAALAMAAVPAIAQDASADTSAPPATTEAQPPADQAPPPADQAAPAPQSADQANAEAAPTPPTTTVQTDAATGAGTVVTDTGSNLTPPPASALNKHYPICRGAIQDECQNPGEGGAPGRSRALKYWPGKPASEGGR